jgi:hypothetical protein
MASSGNEALRHLKEKAMTRQTSQLTMVILCLAPAVIIGASFANANFAQTLKGQITTLLVMERAILAR